MVECSSRLQHGILQASTVPFAEILEREQTWSDRKVPLEKTDVKKEGGGGKKS
jgi:hypothetical protein